MSLSPFLASRCAVAGRGDVGTLVTARSANRPFVRPAPEAASGAGRTKGRVAERAVTKVPTSPRPATAQRDARKGDNDIRRTPRRQKAVCALYGLLRRFSRERVCKCGGPRGAQALAKPV